MKQPTFLPRDLVADLRSHERVSGNSWLVSLLTHEPLWVQTTLRFAQAIERSWSPPLAKRIIRIPIKVLHQALGLLTGISIPTTTKVGPGLHISHFGGIVISPYAEIGPKCFLHQGVTIGVKHTGERPGAPRIGRGVFIGAGAKIIGGVTIGDFASIGANAVVTKDIPTKAVAVGVPARVVKERDVEEWLYQD